MAKMTVKYAQACKAMKELGFKISGDAENAYSRLIEAGMIWDSKIGVWLKLSDEPADPASPLVRIRVWAEKGKAGVLAELVKEGLVYYGPYDLVEMSQPYPCRPPKQNEERIYLTLVRRKVRDG